jgi:hypothetical protein
MTSSEIKAEVLLRAKLNDPHLDFRYVVGERHDLIAQFAGFLRRAARDNEDACKQDGGDRWPPPVGFGVFDGKPTVVVSNYLSSIFPEGHPHHDWAWEHGDLESERRLVRRNEYLIGYRFPVGCTDIPSVNELRQRAVADVKKYIANAYDEPIEAGTLAHRPLGARTASFKGPFDAHQGHWKDAVDKLKRGHEFSPFIDDVRTGIEEFPGFVHPAKSPKAGFWRRQAERPGDLVQPTQKKTMGLQFLAGAGVLLGATLFLHGLTMAWKSLHQPAAEGASGPGSSSNSGENKARAGHSIGWQVAEVGTGAAMILGGVVLYGRGR